MSPVTFPPSSFPSQDRREAETRMGLCGVLSYMMFKMHLVLPPFIHLENPCLLLFLSSTVPLAHGVDVVHAYPVM